MPYMWRNYNCCFMKKKHFPYFTILRMCKVIARESLHQSNFLARTSFQLLPYEKQLSSIWKEKKTMYWPRVGWSLIDPLTHLNFLQIYTNGPTLISDDIMTSDSYSFFFAIMVDVTGNWRNLEDAAWFMKIFAYACKTEGKNGISRLISTLCVNCLISIPEYSRLNHLDVHLVWTTSEISQN